MGAQQPSEQETQELFTQLRAVFSDEQIRELGFRGEPIESTLQRFSQARKFNKEKIVAMMTEALAFRKEKNPEELMARGIDSCLGCPAEEVLQFYSGAYLDACDKQGRPIWYERTGKIDINALHALTDNDKFMDFHICTMEQLGYKYEETSKVQGRYVNSTFSILDLEGLTLSKLGKETMEILKRLTSTDSLIYPETMGKMFIINSPTIFSAAWSVIQGFLDPRTKSKITLCGGPSSWRPKILEYIDEEHLPQELGGKGPPCLPETDSFQDVSMSSSNPRRSLAVELKQGEEAVYKFFTKSGGVTFGSDFNGSVVTSPREVPSSECAHGKSVSGSFIAPTDGVYEVYLEHKGWFARHAMFRLYKKQPPAEIKPSVEVITPHPSTQVTAPVATTADVNGPHGTAQNEPGTAQSSDEPKAKEEVAVETSEEVQIEETVESGENVDEVVGTETLGMEDGATSTNEVENASDSINDTVKSVVEDLAEKAAISVDDETLETVQPLSQ